MEGRSTDSAAGGERVIRRRNRKKTPLRERLLSKTLRGKNRPCWEYTGWTDDRGYAWVHSGEGHRPLQVHKAGWLVHHGPDSIPEGMLVLPCRFNRACWRKQHLTLGTQSDKIRRSMETRGFRPRTPVPVRHYTRRFSENEVYWIRRAGRSGEWTHQQIAEMFGTIQQTISRIVKRDTYRHLPEWPRDQPLPPLTRTLQIPGGGTLDIPS